MDECTVHRSAKESNPKAVRTQLNGSSPVVQVAELDGSVAAGTAIGTAIGTKIRRNSISVGIIIGGIVGAVVLLAS